ncbi:hypothetical protein J437_LFUL000584 [Ladona fulva]|uniref:Uncharacterized protein n=1 Tax=Ladona fulva TaxID=123851 RepID=A0A8K0P462_LADFU|nr:hypothetical protein J437_LFUL000584 [Ladona fulva]
MWQGSEAQACFIINSFLSLTGVFMIVYICITLLLGIPLIFLEIGLGQFCQQGTVKLWQAVPLFKGVGFVKVFASLLMSIYYPMLMTISMFYFIWSAKDSVPISVCESTSPITTFIDPGGGFGDKCLNDTILHPTQSDGTLFAVYIAFIFLIWSLFCLCLCKSVSSYRLSIYILILPTIACIIAELVNATTIGNDNRGIDMLTTLDWQQLKEPKMWYFATIQMFFSTHAGMGNIVTCAGKMYSKTNAFWIAVSYVFLNLITGIMFVVTVYLWIGQTYISISDIKPEIPEIFVALLFSAILSLVQESERKIKWWHIVMAMSGIGFSLGVLFVLQPNLGILHMLDHYVIGRMVIATTILELIGFGWIYGGDTLYKDFEFVLGQKLNVMWKYLWIIIPVLLLALEIMSLIKLPLDGFENKEDYPWIYGIGWSIYLTTWFIVISIAIRQISNQVDYNFTDRFLSSLKPSIDWGPVDPICRHRWKQWGDQYSLTGRRDFTLSRRGTRDYTHSVRANSCPVIITQSILPSPHLASSSENDTDNNSNEPFTLTAKNGSLNHSSNGPFTLQSNGAIGGRQMPKGRYWRPIH